MADSKTILVVDDERDFAEMVRMRLESVGYKVIMASDGLEGLEMAKRFHPDLILMDLMMPNIPGGQAVKFLSKHSETSRIPVIFLTAALGKADVKSAYSITIEDKVFPVVAKPFDPERFLEKIREVLSK